MVAGAGMTARLLIQKDLIALLCRHCYGEPPGDLAEAYGLTREQVWGLLRTHRDTYKAMQKFLTIPYKWPKKRLVPAKSMQGFWKKCNRCREEFWTENQFIFSCDACHRKPDFNSGCDYTTTAWRGAG